MKDSVKQYLEQWAEACPSDRAPRPATEEDVLDAEQRLGFKFPDDYKCFLLAYGGGMIGSNPVIGLGSTKDMSIHETDMHAAMSFYYEPWMGSNVVVISVDGLGNAWLLSLDGVGFADHEEQKVNQKYKTFSEWLERYCFGMTE
jgi:hypothetical protein